MLLNYLNSGFQASVCVGVCGCVLRRKADKEGVVYVFVHVVLSFGVLFVETEQVLTCEHKQAGH